MSASRRSITHPPESEGGGRGAPFFLRVTPAASALARSSSTRFRSASMRRFRSSRFFLASLSCKRQKERFQSQLNGFRCLSARVNIRKQSHILTFLASAIFRQRVLKMPMHSSILNLDSSSQKYCANFTRERSTSFRLCSRSFSNPSEVVTKSVKIYQKNEKRSKCAHTHG